MEKYKLIYKDLYYKIKSGAIAVGAKLPTEEELAKSYDVSKITVKTALNLLKADGLVLRKKRLGTVVLNGLVNGSGEKLIAVIFPQFDRLDVRLINGLKQIAKEKNVSLSFFDSQMEPAQEREILQWLLSQNVAGVLFMPLSQSSNLDIVSMFAIQKIPVVFMDFPSYTPPATTVTSDNFGGAYAMTKYLVDVGHTNVGFFPFSEGFIPTAASRFEGYCHALTDNGIPIQNEFLFTVPQQNIYSIMHSVTDDSAKVSQAFFERYRKLEVKPTAIVCVNDLCAYSLIKESKNYGVAIPDELSVTGFDNLAVSAQSGITTVAQNYFEISKTALLSLLRVIEGSMPPSTIKIRTVLVRRDSVKPLNASPNL